MMPHSDQQINTAGTGPSFVNACGPRLVLVVVVVAALAAIWNWRIATRAVPHRIVGGSMADTLSGFHFDVRCGECGFQFACDRDEAPHDLQAVCPNCGFGANSLSTEEVHAGDRVHLDRSAFGKRTPRRWEIVALREARGSNKQGEGERAAVKRVVALPNEHVAIRHGDLYIDGRLHRKTLAQQRRLAIVVHDDRFRPASQESLLDRWRPADHDSHWRKTEKGYRIDTNADRLNSAPDMLLYHHWRCMPVPRGVPRTDDAPVRDNYAYNQGLSRQLHDVSDLLLACRAKLGGQGEFVLQLHDGYDQFQARLSVRTNEVQLIQSGFLLARTNLPAGFADRDLLLEFSLIDRQAILAINRRIVLHCLVEPRNPSFQPSPTPVGLGAAGVSAEVSDLRIYRDIYYFGPGGTAVDWRQGLRLGSDEFFLLGDNVPISVDSRKWPEPGVSRKMLLGKVLDNCRQRGAVGASPVR